MLMVSRSSSSVKVAAGDIPGLKLAKLPRDDWVSWQGMMHDVERWGELGK
jgi:hypothetical protein